MSTEIELFADNELDLMDMWEIEKILRDSGFHVKSDTDTGIAEILRSLRRVERKLTEIEQWLP